MDLDHDWEERQDLLKSYIILLVPETLGNCLAVGVTSCCQWSVSKEARVFALANPRSLRCDLLNPVIHTVIFVLGYSVNVSKCASESLSGYYILQLELPREKEPFLLYRS